MQSKETGYRGKNARNLSEILQKLLLTSKKPKPYYSEIIPQPPITNAKLKYKTLN